MENEKSQLKCCSNWLQISVEDMIMSEEFFHERVDSAQSNRTNSPPAYITCVCSLLVEAFINASCRFFGRCQ